MIIKSSEYLKGGVDLNSFPNDLKEVCFCGRSNVGKSSLINALTNRKNLAKTSSNPGKTQVINFFIINNAFYLVDLPGYGYAKVSKDKKDTFGKMMNIYFNKRERLKAIFLLVDYKIGPTKDDILMYEFLSNYQYDIYVVGTKADKLKQSELVKNKKLILEKLNLKNDHLILTSSENKKGINDLLSVIEMKMAE